MKALDRMITSCLVLALSFGYTSAKANPLCINCGSDQEVIPVHYEISQGCGASSKPVPDIRQDGLHVHVFIVGIPSDWLKQQHPQWYCKKCHLQFAGQAWTATSSS